jgi:DNA repair protein RecO (recombination protein O)
MFLRYRDFGFVFKKEEKGETDQIFKIFSRDFGKIEVLAKGIRKISSKLRSQIEIFYLSEIEFVQGKFFKRLTDALLIEKFKFLRKSLKRLSIAYQISDVLERLIAGQEKDEKIFDLILNTFKNLNDPKISSKICNLGYYYFFWNLISILGQKPEIYFCSSCQRKLETGDVYFNYNEGGLICFKCFNEIKEGKRIKRNVVKILKFILEDDFNSVKKLKVNDEELLQLKEISNLYFNFLIQNENKQID